MIFIQMQAFAGFWSGAAAMISLHNMIVSFFLYKARQTNISNVLKILINFGNFVRFTGVWGTYMTPEVATLLQCTSLQYVIVIGNFFARVSLTGFLLWRLKQVHNNSKDNWACIILFTIRAALGIVTFGFQRPTTLFDPSGATICDPNEDSSFQPYINAAIGVEFLVDAYVTVRLIQILRRANRNASQLSSSGRKSKRTLFTAVMYWNFLRLIVAFIFHLVTVVPKVPDIYPDELQIASKAFINIILSYVITVDAEIVRIIEGKEKKKGSTNSAGTEKSMTQSPRSPRVPPYSPPRYSPHAQSRDISSSSEEFDEDKVVVVSMKRLSFFEWANVVVGKRFRGNDDEEQYEDDNTEEIVDGPSEEDLEKGPSQDRRDSDFSSTTSVTETSTLDVNPDIVIH